MMLGAALGASRVAVQGTGTAGHPAHIHPGACTELGDVVFPLSDVGAGMMMDGSPMARGDMMGAADAIPIATSSTTVEAALADIVSGGHGINMHESMENIGNFIVRGNIGGMMGTSNLIIGLGELNESGYSSVATLHDNGDGTTTVNVYLTHYEEM